MSSQQVTNVFAQIRSRLENAMHQLPTIVGNEAVNYSLNAFKAQAWDGKAWQKRKDKKNTRSLLIASGRGRRSIRIVRTTATSVTIGSDVPYMAVHNNGGKINRQARTENFVRNRYTRGDKKGKFKRGTTEGAGMSFKAYSYDMPQRQFMGRTRPFITAMHQVVRFHIQKAIR